MSISAVKIASAVNSNPFDPLIFDVKLNVEPWYVTYAGAVPYVGALNTGAGSDPPVHATWMLICVCQHTYTLLSTMLSRCASIHSFIPPSGNAWQDSVGALYMYGLSIPSDPNAYGQFPGTSSSSQYENIHSCGNSAACANGKYCMSSASLQFTDTEY